MGINGIEVRGELHSTDASSGVVIPLYRIGSNTAHTLGSDEYVEIYAVYLLTAVGGDCAIFAGADATPAAGEYVIRGTYGVNGGVDVRLPSTFGGESTRGQSVYCIAPAGVVDAFIWGTIRKV